MPPSDKICMVCGDKALGYNFNAVTCESCKAFFRRNALSSKDFVCPFHENCEITVVTRRFCQKCRLEKCFTIGMRKEYIMSDADKIIKRLKIEQNRAKRKHTNDKEDQSSSAINEVPYKIKKEMPSGSTETYEIRIISNNNNNNQNDQSTDEDTTTSSASSSINNYITIDDHQSLKYIVSNGTSSTPTKIISPSTSTTILDANEKICTITISDKSITTNVNISSLTPDSSPTEIVNRMVDFPEESTKIINHLMKTPKNAVDILSKIINSQKDAMRLIGHLISSPGDALKIISKIMNSPFDALTVFTKFMSSPTDALEIIAKIASSPGEVLQFIQQLMNSPEDALQIMNKFMNSPAEALKMLNQMVNRPVVDSTTSSLIESIETPIPNVTRTTINSELSNEQQLNNTTNNLSDNIIKEPIQILDEKQDSCVDNKMSMIKLMLNVIQNDSNISISSDDCGGGGGGDDGISPAPSNGFITYIKAPSLPELTTTSSTDNFNTSVLPISIPSPSPSISSQHSQVSESILSSDNLSILSPTSSIECTSSKPIKPQILPSNACNQSENIQQCTENSSKTSDTDLMKKIFQDVNERPILPYTVESVLCEAIKLEYEPYNTISSNINSNSNNNNINNSRELNDAERAKLNELIVANKALYAPLDDDLSELIFDDSLKANHNSQDPQLLKLVNLTAVAIRRLIKMSKKINAFKNMCQEDQVALLKGGCTEMMILRSVMQYDVDHATWKIPHNLEEMSNLKVDVLKLAKGNVYEEHENFIKTFDPIWRKDENIILIMCAIVLFTPTRPKTIHSDVLKLEQNSYFYLLRRYLESVYPGCEAKSTFLKLIQKINELQRLNEVIIGVYLDVNPSQVEPLLREIFDLKNH